MSKDNRIAGSVEPPVEVALVLVCEKCGKRVADGGKNPSHQLASQIKRLAKAQFERGSVRAVLTSCLDLCPEKRIAVAIVPARRPIAPLFLETRCKDLDEASACVVKMIHRVVTPQ